MKVKHTLGTLKSEKGFTLVEVIMSIAILAIASLFILDFFLVAADSNQFAQDVDKGTTLAVSILEEFKQVDSPADFEELDLLEGGYLNIEQDHYYFTLYYDADFHIMEFKDQRPEDAEFIGTIVIEPADEPPASELNASTSGDSGRIVRRRYSISLDFRRTHEVEKADTKLVTFTTSKYLVYIDQ